ncbi:hypothetical protein M0R04_15290 [Candidatus Dojkabacteria bacterium]|jgi:hypothetical protein|nr:hypothetical protein [Candidatus Dojkabacteria bacterium]
MKLKTLEEATSLIGKKVYFVNADKMGEVSKQKVTGVIVRVGDTDFWNQTKEPIFRLTFENGWYKLDDHPNWQYFSILVEEAFLTKDELKKHLADVASAKYDIEKRKINKL